MVLSSSVTCNYIAVICVWLAKPDVTANTRNSLKYVNQSGVYLNQGMW